jgi:putative DNA-invertase from lambdoid prophage Rac
MATQRTTATDLAAPAPGDALPHTYVYTRVSGDGQDTANQLHGISIYADRHGFTPLTILRETESRRVPWQKRQLGAIVDGARAGDRILLSEISRAADGFFQAVEFLRVVLEKGIHVHVVKQGLVLDNSESAKFIVAFLGQQSAWELEFISQRTKEALARRKAEGKPLGRPRGTGGKCKLDGCEVKVAGFMAIKLSARKMAIQLGVNERTVRRFLAAKADLLAPLVEASRAPT